MTTSVETTIMLAAYEQDAEPTMFFSGMFKSPPRNFHNSEAVEYDIVRGEEEISIVVQDLSAGARANTVDIYTNKKIIPPIHKEEGTVTAHNLIKRRPGANPFEDIDYQVNAIDYGMRLGKQLQRKIIRSTELQAVQVMTLGVVTLTDSAGLPLYQVDWKPKASHFPTTGTIWTDPSATIVADLLALANTIRGDGLVSPDTLTMGEASYEAMITDTELMARFDNHRIEGNAIVPMQQRGGGGIYRGLLEIGNYRFDIFTYPGRYTHPVTGVSTNYLPDGKVVMSYSGARLDATFGGIPILPGGDDPRVPSQLKQRLSIPGRMMDMQLHAWIAPNGQSMTVEAGTRPLMIPTGIDTYGCLDTLL